MWQQINFVWPRSTHTSTRTLTPTEPATLHSGQEVAPATLAGHSQITYNYYVNNWSFSVLSQRLYMITMELKRQSGR